MDAFSYIYRINVTFSEIYGENDHITKSEKTSKTEFKNRENDRNKLVSVSCLHGSHRDRQDDQVAQTSHHSLKLFGCQDKPLLWRCRTWDNFLFNRITWLYDIKGKLGYL